MTLTELATAALADAETWEDSIAGLEASYERMHKREPLLAAGVLQLLEEQRKLTLLWKALGDNTSEVEDLTRDRDEYKQQHDNALASWAVDRKNLEDAAHRSRCDLLDEQAKCADLTRQLAEATRELERWRHGVTIEGDFVCPDSLALSEARAELRAVGKVTP